MSGPCAKRRVVAFISVIPFVEYYIGTNDCANPQAVCPRAPGEGYEKCKSICQQEGHAEVMALRAAGDRARGAWMLVKGHDHCCDPCLEAIREAGIEYLEIQP